MTFPAPRFDQLRRLTDAGGLYEHARGTLPRPEHGYCVDDVARGLVVVCRESGQQEEHRDLRAHYLSFLLAAQGADGRFRNRRNTALQWTDEPGTEDCWGRALWGLGAAVSCAGDHQLRAPALAAFDRGAQWRSPWPHAMAFAALGAAEVLAVLPGHHSATALIADAAAGIGRPAPGDGWRWPYPRLTYANAALPDALLAAGAALGDPGLIADALTLLGWLLETQTRRGHLSVAPVGGSGPRDLGPGFDQQPIEVAALADACARAFAVTADPSWLDGIELAASWFLGANDAATPLYDERSFGGCDGLESHGRNANQGAESTLALLSTLQHARLLAVCRT
jgi:hypothetical protein